MKKKQIEPKAASLGKTAYHGEHVRSTESSLVAYWPNFMLARPKPAPKKP